MRNLKKPFTLGNKYFYVGDVSALNLPRNGKLVGNDGEFDEWKLFTSKEAKSLGSKVRGDHEWGIREAIKKGLI